MEVASRFGLFLLICFWSLPVDRDLQEGLLVVWNVGQGQWVTIVEHDNCWHFDSGGERAPWSGLRELCGRKHNRLSFSHWDWDHVSFTRQVANALPDTCVLMRPQGSASCRKEALFQNIKKCNLSPPFQSWSDPTARNSNDRSRVVLWRGVLIPGDSSQKEERIWVKALKDLGTVRYLVLGHHGSRTSTSGALLSQLPALQTAITSARKRKYGHPHAETERRLRDRRIPLLQTEEWGSLRFAL